MTLDALSLSVTAVTSKLWGWGARRLVSWSSGTSQRPVFVHFLPVSTTRPRYVTVHAILLMWTSQPALHSVTMEINENPSKPGMMWPVFAFLGSA